MYNIQTPNDFHRFANIEPIRLSRPLAGRVALVTGSTRGIGAGIAEKLAEAGCDIILNGRTDQDDGTSLAAGLTRDFNVRADYFSADLRSGEQVKALAAFALERLKKVDILVNNAGIQHVASVENFPDERWDEIIALNLSSAFRTIKAVLPGMRSRGWGRIINIASVHGLVGSEQKSAYVAAKHGLVGLTKVVALEAANDGITCNAICPGWVLTDIVQRQVESRSCERQIAIEQAEKDLLSAKQPMHRFSTVAGIGSLATFLCSDAAQTMTGSALTMDGGWTAV
jgi:3-hydroxybutyrate dehydrogenase